MKKLSLLNPPALVLAGFLLFSVFFFKNITRPDWIYTGDTLSIFAVYSFHYSGIARGEYPIWNPLVRAGEPEYVLQGLQLASPLSNLVAVTSVLCGIQDVVLSFSFYILLQTLLYALGIYFLVSSWTGNRYAGALASILSLGSSSVFFSPYHISFINIVHSVPWMLYAATSYYRNHKFRYLIIFALAFNSGLYSYMISMGLTYIIMLSAAGVIFYYRKFPEFIRKAKEVPVWHLLTIGAILFVVILPALVLLGEYRNNLVPFSRVSLVTITDDYTVTYRNEFTRIYQFVLFSPGFWGTLFTGVIRDSYNNLRQYVGPLVFPLVFVALFSSKRAVWCIALSGLLTLLLVGGIFPSGLFYSLPVFSLMRNQHFLLQFFLFAMIVLAGFGFASLLEGGLRKTFNTAAALLAFSSLAFLFATRNISSGHNDAALILTASSSLAGILLLKFLPQRNLAFYFIILSIATVLFSNNLAWKIPDLYGSTKDNPELAVVRDRSEHSLQFRYERPDDIEKVIVPFYTSFGKDEFSSCVTLKDNSYKTMGGEFGLSCLQVLNNYYLFMSLNGHEKLMRNKFLFFSKAYTSSRAADMTAFRRNPDLLDALLKSNTALVDGPVTSSVSLGSFSPAMTNPPPPDKAIPFQVDVKEYKANSIKLAISASHPGIFVYTDLWHKGWKAILDGKYVPVLKVFNTFKGVELTPGVHTLDFHFSNMVLVSILAMNLMFTFLLAGLILRLLMSAAQGKESVKDII